MQFLLYLLFRLGLGLDLIEKKVRLRFRLGLIYVGFM